MSCAQAVPSPPFPPTFVPTNLQVSSVRRRRLCVPPSDCSPSVLGHSFFHITSTSFVFRLFLPARLARPPASCLRGRRVAAAVVLGSVSRQLSAVIRGSWRRWQSLSVRPSAGSGLDCGREATRQRARAGGRPTGSGRKKEPDVGPFNNSYFSSSLAAAAALASVTVQPAAVSGGGRLTRSLARSLALASSR